MASPRSPRRLAWLLTVSVAALLVAPAWATAQPLRAEHHPRTKVELVRGQATESEAQAVIVFTKKGKDNTLFELTPEQEKRLTANPKFWGTKKLEGEVVNVTLRQTPVAYQALDNSKREGNGYAITCRVRLNPREATEMPTETFHVELPGVSEVQNQFQGLVNGSFGGTEFIWDAKIYASEEALAESKQVWNQQVEQNKAREKAKQLGNLAGLVCGSVLLLAALALVIGAVVVYQRSARGTGHITVGPSTRLPACCMRCGEPAKGRVSRTFSWSSPTAGIMFGVVGSLLARKTVTLKVPLCEEHSNHWGGLSGGVMPTLFLLGSLVGGGVLFFVLQAVGLALLGAAVMATAVTVGLTAYLLAPSTKIRAVNIQGARATLAHVSERFIDQYNDDERDDEEEKTDRSKRAARDDRPAPPPRRRRDREDDDQRDNPFAGLR